MLDRLNPLVVLRASWRSLEIRTETQTLPDKAARAILVLVPAAVGLVVFLTKTAFQNPGTIFAGLSLFSAGLLAAFSQLVSIRGRYTRPDDFISDDSERLTRAMLDEAVFHILTAVLVSAGTAFLVVVAMNVGPGDGQSISRCFSTAVAVAGTYLFLIFVMTVRKLLGAYAVANDVDLTRTRNH